jgi:hypothetical protein
MHGGIEERERKIHRFAGLREGHLLAAFKQLPTPSFIKVEKGIK